MPYDDEDKLWSKIESHLAGLDSKEIDGSRHRGETCQGSRDA